MELTFKNRYYLLFLSVLLGPLCINSMIPIFTPLQSNFSLNSVAFISVAISIYTVPYAFFQLFTGTFSDVVDKKKVVLIGFLIFTMGIILTLVSVLAMNYVLFLIGFFIQGIGFSFINPTILAILGIITPEKKSGFIMGLFNASAGLGVSVGAYLASVFATYIDFRALFIFNLIFTFTCIASFVYALQRCEALVCRSFENNLLREGVNIKKQEDGSLIKATLTQLKHNLKTPIILLGFLGFFCFFTIITVSNVLNEQISMSIPGYTEEEIITNVSLILTLNGILSIIMSPIIGSLLKKLPPFILLTIGFILISFIVLLPFCVTLLQFLMVSMIIYLGSICIWPSLFKKAMDLDPDAKGTNSSIINSLRFTGYALVGPFYLLFGIPVIYIWVICFNILGLTFVLFLKRVYSNNT